MIVQAYMSTVELTTGVITVRAKGVGKAAMGSAERMIPIGALKSIHLRNASALTNGQLELVTERGKTLVHFRRKHQESIRQIYDAIVNAAPAGLHQGPSNAPLDKGNVGDALARMLGNVPAVTASEKATRLDQLADFEQQSELAGGGGVFISYSHSDADVVDAIAARFDQDGINYWRDDKDLLVGEVIDDAISRGIQRSALFLVVLTPNSITSRWTARELDEAAHEEVEGGKVILPVLAKNLKSSDVPPKLRRKLHVDLSGGQFETGYARLHKSIRVHLLRRAP